MNRNGGRKHTTSATALKCPAEYMQLPVAVLHIKTDLLSGHRKNASQQTQGTLQVHTLLVHKRRARYTQLHVFAAQRTYSTVCRKNVPQRRQEPQVQKLLLAWKHPTGHVLRAKITS